MMTIISITKQYPTYIVTYDNGKNTVYNAQTKEIIHLGRKAKTTNLPQYLLDTALFCSLAENDNRYFHMVDTLMSIFPNLPASFFTNYSLRRIYPLFNDKNRWKHYLPYLQNELKKCSMDWDYRHAIDSALSLYHDDIIKNAMQDIMDNDYIHFLSTVVNSGTNFNDFKNFLIRNAPEDDNLTYYFKLVKKVYSSSFARLFDPYETMRIVLNFLDNCKSMDEYPALNGDICMIISKKKMEYEAKKHILEENTFKNVQTAHDYSFSTERFHTVIPTTYEECQNFGKHFHNCLGNYEWNTYLRNGKRGVIIICDNNTDTPLICCDFDADSLRIVQYLGERNSRIIDGELSAFKNMLQRHLFNCK